MIKITTRGDGSRDHSTGTYTIAITGTSGSITQTAVLTLKVTKTTPSFTVTASPNSLTLSPGSSGTSTISIAAVGPFNAAVTLSTIGQGTGNSTSFSVNPIPAPGSGTSIMTVTVGSKAKLGTRTITIYGKGGGLTRHTTLTLNVVN